MYKTLLTLGFFLLVSQLALAQDVPLNNLRVKRVIPGAEPFLLDSLTVIPQSLEVWQLPDRVLVDPSGYSLQGNYFFWKNAASPGLVDSTEIEIHFRVFPFDLSQKFNHLDSTKIQPKPDGSYADYNYTPYDEGDALINFKGLNYDGSYTTGVSFGNSQSLVVNSNFNLRMSGTLGDDIEIAAAISDQNIPLQPEGNTQQLQEFDKIFIQLKRRETSLIAGDYELARPAGYFMNYYKKLQGATFSNATELGQGKLSNQLSLAVARGKFARNTILQQEGNQGPYRLRGNEGETFIIVLAGTEKVYLDGQVLQRGLEEDYVIDYNRGDITFTNRRLITKDSRIIVEFEYSDQNYLRSLYAYNTQFQTDKLQLYFNLYSEQDSKTSGNVNDLDSLDKRLLSEAGDRLDRAYAPGIDPVKEFSDFRVQYKMKDTLFVCSGGTIAAQILTYSINPDSAKYTANFLQVGAGQGNYQLSLNSTANGRVYQWIAPDPLTCQPRGEYEPIVKLIAPNQKQLFTLGGVYQLSKNSSIHSEVALSNYDPNRFSKLDENNDLGIAAFTKYQYQKKLGTEERSWQLSSNLSYEFVQENFKSLNPYRPPEFTRDWNLRSSGSTIADSTSNEQLLAAGVNLAKPGLGKIGYELGTFLRSSIYTGVRHNTLLNLQKKGFELKWTGSLLTTREPEIQGDFFRPRLELSKSFAALGDWKIGVYGEREKNQRRDFRTDTLNSNSFYYDLWRVYVESPENENLSWNTSYSQRYDYAPAGENFGQSTQADDVNLQGQWKQGKASRLNWNLNYRQLHIIDQSLSKLDPQETFLGRLEHNLNLLSGAVFSTTNYEIGGGQEPLVEYRYLEVPKGEGLYFWDIATSDYNGDGVPQIDEIQESPYPDQANIVRLTLFTDQFIRTNNTQLNQSIRLEPRKLWRQQKGIKSFLGKFSTQSAFQINRRTRAAEGVSNWNPFQINIPDSALVALSFRIQNTLFFRPDATTYDFRIGQSNRQNRLVLTSGFQSQQLQEQFFKARWNISARYSTDLETTLGRKENDYQLFNQQDYDIAYFRIIPAITIQPNNSFRAILKYKWEEGKNQLPGTGETASQHNFSLETTYNKASTTSLRGGISYVLVKFDGVRNSPVELALLEGLKNGKNFLWNLTLTRSISKDLQLGVSYDGRKTGTSRMVHVGSMQLGARF